MVVIAVDKKDQATRIAELLRDEFPLVKVMARAFDRGHAIELVKAGVEYQIREMFESALTLSGRGAARPRFDRRGDRRAHRGRARSRPAALQRADRRRPAGRARPAAVQCRGAGARERRGRGQHRSPSCSRKRRENSGRRRLTAERAGRASHCPSLMQWCSSSRGEYIVMLIGLRHVAKAYRIGRPQAGAARPHG